MRFQVGAKANRTCSAMLWTLTSNAKAPYHTVTKRASTKHAIKFIFSKSAMSGYFGIEREHQ